MATNYDEDNIKVGKHRNNGSTSYLIQVTDEHDNTLYIELSRDGSYWTVNSGGIFRKGYSDKKETVAKTEPQQPNNAISSGSSLSAEAGEGITSTEPNGEPTVSGGKGTNISETGGENVENNVSGMPMRKAKRKVDGKMQEVEEEDWMATTPEVAYDYLYVQAAELGLKPAMADNMVSTNLKNAEKKLKDAEKATGSVLSVLQKQKAAQEEVDYWKAVEKIRKQEVLVESAEEGAGEGEGEEGERAGAVENGEGGNGSDEQSAGRIGAADNVNENLNLNDNGTERGWQPNPNWRTEDLSEKQRETLDKFEAITRRARETKKEVEGLIGEPTKENYDKASEETRAKVDALVEESRHLKDQLAKEDLIDLKFRVGKLLQESFGRNYDKDTKDTGRIINGWASLNTEIGRALKDLYGDPNLYIGNMVVPFREQKGEGTTAKPTKEQKELTKDVVEVLKETGVPTHYVTKKGQEMLDKYRELVQFMSRRNKKSTLGTASVTGNQQHHPTVVSSVDGAKILKNLEKVAKDFEKLSNQSKFFIGTVGKALEAKQQGSKSEYADFETDNGMIVAIRLADHNARVSNSDYKGRNNVISIVIAPKKGENKGIINDGKAHIVEHFYEAIDLRKADGKPLADIVRAIADALHTGKFVDPTGLAKTGEVNAETLREMRAWHGSGADFEAFDHSHMGEGEGAQAFGWGTYVTEVKGIGKNYAEKIGKKRRNYNEILERKNLTNEDRAVVNDINKEPFALSEKEKVERLKARYEEEIKKAEENVKSDTPILEAIDEAMKIIEGMTDLEWEKYSENKSGRLAELDDYLSENVGFIEFLDEKTREQALKTGNVDRETALSLHRQAEELNREAQAKLKSLSWISNALSRYGRILYEVEIPDDNGSNYLEWDKPVSKEQQGMIYKQLREKGITLSQARQNFWNGKADEWGSGSKLYNFLVYQMDDRGGETSRFLHDAGFTGIKYPAQFLTGGRSDNAKNYVIFDEGDLKITDKVKFFKTPQGEVLGYTLNGEIYIDPRVATPDTPIHEYTHLWAQVLRSSNPTAWAKLTEEMKGVEDGRLWEYVRGRYPELKNEDELTEEVFAHYSGKRGRERLEADMREEMSKTHDVFEKAKVATMFHKLREILSNFWNMARDLFAGKVEGIENLTAEDFADMVMGDLARGYNPVRARTEQSKALDKEYMEAVERGDMETAQRMVDAEARRKGYISGADYRMSHRAPNREDDVSLADLSGNSIVPDDYWTHPQYYQYEPYDYQSFYQIRNAMNNAAEKKAAGKKAVGSITMYRAVPKSVKEDTFRNGDWISPSLTYAKQEGESIPGDYRIISMKCKSSNVWWDANDINEWGYDDGKDYAYQNTKNNRKLLDAVTYDDNDNVIPLSKRFNKRNADIRYAKGARTDRSGNYIGDGNWHVRHNVETFDEYPQIKSSVSESATTESVYVTYRNTENGKSIRVRFSNHENNATKFGDELDGNLASRAEILYHLGLRKREFVPLVEAYIPSRQVSRKDLKNGTYPESEYTIQEMYDKIRKGESIADEVGKVSKGSNYLILGDGSMSEVKRINAFGETVTVGDYKYSKIDGEDKATEQDIEAVNSRFNEELQKQIEGTLPQGHVYNLGMPSEILKNTGFPNVPIELSASHLAEKASNAHHPFGIEDVKDIVKALQNPMAVFSYGDKGKAQNVIVEIQHDDKNFVVGIHFNQEHRGAIVNDIRGLYPKDNAEWLNWITQGKLLHADKEKIQALIEQQRRNLAEVPYLDLNSVAKILNNFENPQINTQNAEDEGGNEAREGYETYTTRAGEQLSMRSLMDDIEGRDGASDLTESGTAATEQPVEPTSIRLRKLKPGETCNVERRYEESRQFSFTGKERIESMDDVAYIFKQLETAAVENAFVVLVKDGRPTVLHVGMGGYAQTSVDIRQAMAAYVETQPDAVYFVHNHPSGNLKASREDMGTLATMREVFGKEKVKDGNFDERSVVSSRQSADERAMAAENRMEQIKRAYPDATVVEQKGDIYEASGEAAERVSKVMGKVRDEEGKIQLNEREMDEFLRKMTSAGQKVIVGKARLRDNWMAGWRGGGVTGDRISRAYGYFISLARRMVS